MGKDDKEATRKELEEKLKLQTAGEKSYFNKPLLLFGIITFITGLNHYFKWYPLPEIFIDIILIIAGLWLFKLALGSGFYGRRKDLFKRYI